MADETVIYRADHVLEYPFVRSVGPVVGAFLTGLRDGKVVGIKGTGGRIIVPPTEYDPETGDETTEVVEVGPEGTVTSWSWAGKPRAKQPLEEPFANAGKSARVGKPVKSAKLSVWVMSRLDALSTTVSPRATTSLPRASSS